MRLAVWAPSGVRLLKLSIEEPVPGRVMPAMAESHGADEAARRYRAVVLTTLRQLRGLSEARLRLWVDPEEAAEAIRFWLLPRLADSWQMESGVFRSSGWEIDFGGETDGFSIVASGEILCPNLGARWVHAAMLGLGRTAGEAIGPSSEGGEYFRAAPTTPVAEELPPRILPELPVIRDDRDWQAAIDSALGAALKKAWEEEA